MTDEERRPLQLAFIEASTNFAEAVIAKRALEDRVVRIARQLTADPNITDAEAVERAGREALEVLKGS